MIEYLLTLLALGGIVLMCWLWRRSDEPCHDAGPAVSFGAGAATCTSTLYATRPRRTKHGYLVSEPARSTER